MSFSSLPLSYCTNVHPGSTVDEIINGLTEHTSEVRRQLDAPMAAGLWLCRSVVSELLDDKAALERLAQSLWQHDLCCYTLNAFPYGDFHSERVKEQVYLPDWASSDRLNYTKHCARILAELLPEGSEGSISTVPLGGRMNPTTPDFQAICFHNLILLAKWLKELHQSTGRLIRLAIEPEPLCEMSSIPEDAVPLFRSLFEMAEALGQLPSVQEHIGLCFDVCHQAVVFEDVTTSINQIVSSDIRINKVHITNAVELLNPSENKAGREALMSYVEPRYLHQTFAKMNDGSIVSRLDLTADDILRNPSDSFLQADAWRVHFHVPVFADDLGPLRTTRPDLKAALQAILKLEYAPHLEVETYTWPVMPDEHTAVSSLSSQITRELASAYNLLRELC
ncbi:MAG: metabolite traffic protein EboE [Fuerstiella sp.]|nr:metabolite traffic protein EboE [Fuerstiella sp.]MCP4505598.1 metabolite traffic protein EboE [Fuerstiella sp.]